MNKTCFAVVLALCSGPSISSAQQSVTLTSTADFQRGNNEGLISTAQDRITRDRVTAGTVGSWTSSTALPALRSWHVSVAYNGFVYAIGGMDGFSNVGDVFVAPLNANGSVGAWTSTTALPSARRIPTSVAYNGFLYVIAGDSNTARESAVLVAPINTDGTLGSWTATTALPTGLAGPTSVAYNGFLYVLGGNNTSFSVSTEVLFAPIHADGSIGNWNTSSPLPTGCDLHASVAYNGYIYAMGGEINSGDVLADVVVAPLNANGSVGTWTSTTPLTSGRVGLVSAAYNGFIYAIGGYGTDYLDEVLVAPFNADGSVGTWTSTSALPSGRYLGSSAVHNGFLYVIGGDANAGTLSDVVVAGIDADTGNINQALDRLRGVYSHLVDLGSDTSNRTIILGGQTSSGSVIRLQVRVAPAATGVFGTETIVASAALGNPIQVAGSGRYVWLRLTLDDTATTNVNQPTYISDISIIPLSPPTAGVVNDGPGTDIGTQASTTTIEANWSGFTPSTGDTISFYEWAIGTAPGLTNVQDWTSVGLATSATNSSLSLSVGVKYVSVRATTAAGLTSLPATSNGVQVQAPPAPPSGDDDDKKGRCSSSVSSASASLMALLGGIVLLASGFRRRQTR